MFNKEEIKLAKPCYRAIKKTSKEQCDRCGACLGKDEPKKWEWEPEEGDCIILNDAISGDKMYLLFSTGSGLGYDAGISCGRSTDYADEKYYDDFTQDTKDICIPLLHWEKLEEILEGMGYVIDLNVGYHYSHKQRPFAIDESTWNNAREYKGASVIASCSVYSSIREAKTRYLFCTFGKTRQEAVMRAIIELGKC